ncbi:hypothetical protein HDG38_003289 [Paraburkholderia sp. WSM4177]|nr:hypothetical protein [Paraburkholderia sp. WSM4177]MBB5485485.1 hypothetical protein [Paraburkholderia sp. WSM4180]
MNMIQEELRAIVVAAGITPSKTTYTQVLSAIKRLGQNTVVLADTGAANAYSAVNATPLVAGTWLDGVVQQVKIAHANTGASTYAPDGLTAIPIYGLGLQPLQGGELVVGGTAVLMHATIAGVNSGNPICVLMECAGGAQQVTAGTQSNHAVNLGQFGSSIGSSGYTKLPNGMIFQWSSGVSSGTGSPNLTITFPLAFPNACLGAAAITSGGNTIASVNGLSKTAASLTTYLASSGAITSALGFYIVAIGY